MMMFLMTLMMKLQVTSLAGTPAVAKEFGCPGTENGQHPCDNATTSSEWGSGCKLSPIDVDASRNLAARVEDN